MTTPTTPADPCGSRVIVPETFRECWPSIAEIPCVATLLQEISDARELAGLAADNPRSLADALFAERRDWFEQVTEPRLLLREFLDLHDEPCRFDHEEFCQEHMSSAPCLIHRARQALDTITKEAQ